jgi:hypothetical protein
VGGEAEIEGTVPRPRPLPSATLAYLHTFLQQSRAIAFDSLIMSQKPSISKPRPASNAGAAGKLRPKFTHRAPASTEDRLKKLHAGLVDQINEGYLENAIKTCRKSRFFVASTF